MARKLVSVDDNLHLPPEVEAALKSNLDSEFSDYVNTASSSASEATASASTAVEARDDIQDTIASWNVETNDAAVNNLIEGGATATRTTLDTLYGAAANGGLIYGRDGKRYNLVAGHIRNEGTGWQYRVNDTHDCLVGDNGTVETESDRIVLNYPGMGNAKAVAMWAGPDEALAAAGITVGCSVSNTSARLFLGGKVEHSGYVTYSGSGSTFNVSGTPGVTATWHGSEGYLEISHPRLPSAATSQYTMQLTPRGGSGHAVVSTKMPLGDSAFGVEFYTYSGSKITSLSSIPPFLFTHGTGGRLNPALIHTNSFPLSNIWFLGVFEAL